ncbi:Acetylpolyamine aminohydrolase [Cladophialophora carrionii]|uniref:Acetylpolyamine aminohydrolase n=1 Tax=Cladophialophora carrionii TaxID=86049 RepID=A0A1C1CM54_9EURO|nr:Acetylpolyamine aminohydrolase [Cladophialophora carrionii]
MLVILWDPDTLLHQTVELLGSKLIPALESPARLEAILKALRTSKHELRTIESAHLQDDRRLTRLLELTSATHSPDYLQHLRDIFQVWLDAGLIKIDGHVLPECFVYPTTTGKPLRPPKDLFARAGYYAFDMSSGIMSDSYKAIVASANLASEGTDMLAGFANIPNDIDTVVALCRPPGHHCDGQRAGGYCYINNAALAASTWRSEHPEARVGILDIDFHHGNGTQEIFYADPKTLYVSIHGEDEFPYYTGAADETGSGDAQGTNINLPLKVGSSIEVYMEKLDYGLKKLVESRPEFLIVSLGFDTFHSDPLGHFQIHTEDYETISRTTRHALKGIPALVLLEGGYVIEHLGANMLSFLKGWSSD